ncbi:MAG: hypothetical protein HY753_00590, partial [Nitrospirae bacterium]|nr:hypothetical protein [Nitrospirota bacterium]
KRFVLIIIAAATVLVSIILIALGKNPFLALGIGLLIVFLVYALWNLPKKHKDFSLSDQREATSRALGGSGAPDLSHLKPEERKSRQKN